MSNLQAIVERDIVVTSNMMVHDGGAKFYEVLLLQSQPSNRFNPLCMTRWGSINKQERGGAWGKGKLLTPHRPESYRDAIIDNKFRGGYTSSEIFRRDSPCYDYLLKLGFFDLWGDDNLNVVGFVKQFGIDRTMLIDDIVPETSTPIIITRSPLYGSWS